MTPPDIIWGGILFAGLTFEAYTLGTRRQGDTLSETTRRAFRTRTSRAGRAVFITAWSGFAVWYLGHIVGWWW